MSNQNIQGTQIRIPNLPSGRIVDAQGNATDDELAFRQALITLLQTLMGAEGLVMPSQNATNIAAIVAGTSDAPGATPNFTYNMQPGTFIYNTTSDTVQVSVLVLGVPTIKTVTVT